MTLLDRVPHPRRALATPVRATLLLAALGLASAPGLAASQGDEDACRPDVFRLCASEIPNEDAIVACLNDRLASLSPACRSVMAPAAPATPERRRRPAGALGPGTRG